MTLLVAARVTLPSAEVPPAGAKAPTWEQLTAEAVRALKAAKAGEAERLCGEAMKLAEAAGPGDTRLAKTYALLGEIQRWQKELDPAEESFKKAVAVCEKAVGPNHPEMIGPLESLANFHLHTRVRHDQVATLYERILHIVEQMPGPDLREVAIRARNLADVDVLLGRHAQAEPLYRKALALAEKLDDDVASQLLTVAGFYRAWKKHDQAEPLAERALALREKAFAVDPGPDTNLDVANALNMLAQIYLGWNKPDQAEPLCRRSLTIMEQVAGGGSSDLAAPLLNLASSLQGQGKQDLAAAHYQRAVAVVEEGLGPECPELADVLEKYAALLKDMQKPADAKKLLERAESIRKKIADG
jgi:tetratricopeptide (TPR) repeat protein